MWTTILTGFFCGCSFVAGAMISSALWSLATKRGRDEFNDELRAYWQRSLEAHDRQVAALQWMAENVNEIALRPKQ